MVYCKGLMNQYSKICKHSFTHFKPAGKPTDKKHIENQISLGYKFEKFYRILKVKGKVGREITPY
jgi:hypothetical protein